MKQRGESQTVVHLMTMDEQGTLNIILNIN